MLGCFNFIKKVNGKLGIFFRKIPVHTDINTLVDVILYYDKGYDRFLNDLVDESTNGARLLLESGDVYLGFKIFRKEDIKNLGACTDLFDMASNVMKLRIRNAQDLSNFSFYHKLSDMEKKVRLEKVIKELKKNTDYVFDPVKAKKATHIDIPPSINGLAPDYYDLKDTMYEGNRVVYRSGEKDAILKINYSSVRDIDFRLAYNQLGISNDKIVEIEKLYVWHHLDDFDPVTGVGTMQLVLKSLHNASGYGNALNHTGGVAIWKFFHLVEYT